MANNRLLVFCKRNPTRKTYCLWNRDLFQESAVSSFQGALDMQETADNLLFINTFVHTAIICPVGTFRGSYLV